MYRGGRSAFLKTLVSVSCRILILRLIQAYRVGENKAVFAPTRYIETSDGDFISETHGSKTRGVLRNVPPMQ